MQKELFAPDSAARTTAEKARTQSHSRIVKTKGGQTVELIAILPTPLTQAALCAAFPTDRGGAALLDATRLCAETVLHAEERLYTLYRRTADAAQGRHLILRAPVPDSRFGIRTLLERPAFFTAHLSAALRASPHGRITLLLPFVSTSDEIAAARQLTERAMQHLSERGQPFDELVELGIELATPAAALLSRTLASETDQLFLDLDRTAALALSAPTDSPLFTDLPHGSERAILCLAEVAVGNAHLAGRRITLYGKLWEHPKLLPHLVAMGTDALAVPVARLRDARDRIRALP